MKPEHKKLIEQVRNLLDQALFFRTYIKRILMKPKTQVILRFKWIDKEGRRNSTFRYIDDINIDASQLDSLTVDLTTENKLNKEADKFFYKNTLWNDKL